MLIIDQTTMETIYDDLTMEELAEDIKIPPGHMEVATAVVDQGISLETVQRPTRKIQL